MRNNTIETASFGPDRLVTSLKLDSASPKLKKAVCLLRDILMNDGEAWQKSSQADREDVDELIRLNIAPILREYEIYRYSFSRAPAGIEDFEDVLIAGFADHMIYHERFNHAEASLVRDYYETTKILHEGDDAAEVPHQFPTARRIYTDMLGVHDGLLRLDEVSPCVHFSYLMSVYLDHENVLLKFQDNEAEMSYDDKRQFIDNIDLVRPDFLIDGDMLSEAVASRQKLILAARPAKASFSVVPSSP